MAWLRRMILAVFVVVLTIMNFSKSKNIWSSISTTIPTTSMHSSTTQEANVSSAYRRYQQYLSSSTDTKRPRSRPKGVFIIKTKKAQQACRTICTLTSFFNGDTANNYPIQIFTEQNYTPAILAELQSYAGPNVTVTIIVDSERWKELPPTLTPAEREQVLSHCINMTTPDIAKCTTTKWPLSYVYMGYWRYMLMQYEPSLEDFDYFVTVDADAYFTQPFPDPFRLMDDNSLTGIFNVDLYQNAPIDTGIQETAEQLFSLKERQNTFLDNPRNRYFDQDGRWWNQQNRHPSIWGNFFGGRLDFFRQKRYLEFARRMVPYTYTFRTDEQAVIAVAWALMGVGPKVWFLSQRNISMGVYHQGWVDQHQVVRREAVAEPVSPTGASIAPSKRSANTSEYWLNTMHEFDDNFKSIPHADLLVMEKYTKSLGYEAGHSWERCICARTKVNFVLRFSCANIASLD